MTRNPEGEGPLTVGKLIKILQEYDPDEEVFFDILRDLEISEIGHNDGGVAITLE